MSRLLNHSRFPNGRAHGFAALANIGVLRAGRAQPLYLLTPAGRFALRATAHRADASLRRTFGSLWAFGPSAHRAHASLRATGLTLPSVPSKVNSYRPAFPGRSIFAEGADRAHRSFRSLANIGVLRAGRAQPLYLLTPAGRFGPSAQVPTEHTLPFAPQGWRFPPVPGGRGVCAPGRKHFLSFWRKRPPQADFFDKLKPQNVFCGFSGSRFQAVIIGPPLFSRCHSCDCSGYSIMLFVPPVFGGTGAALLEPETSTSCPFIFSVTTALNLPSVP